MSDQPDTRFQLTRAGLLNLFEYAEQTFTFSGGHLLLRGHNGAGKSKALELLLPFVLDGDITPTKLDPFRTNARNMKWNLLMGGRHDNRVGYAWLEFSRQRHGQPQYVTAVVGVKATQDHSSAQTWFAVLQDVRVGYDVSFINEATREPYPRKRLAGELGDGAWVTDVAQDYRDRLNELLFGFAPNSNRYATMLELQRQLRKPQLSASLDPEHLSGILSRALPEVGRDHVAQIGQSLDHIEQLRNELEVARANHQQLQGFVGLYETYAKALLADRLSTLRSANAREREARSGVQSTLARKDAAAALLDALAAKITGLATDEQHARGEHDELLASPEFRTAERLGSLRDAAAAAKRRRSEIDIERGRAVEDLEAAHREHAHLQKETASVVAARDAVDAQASEAASRAGIELHAELAEQLATGDPAAVASELLRRAAERQSAIDRQRQLRREFDRLSDAAATHVTVADEADTEAGEARDKREQCDLLLAAARDRLAEQIDDWSSDPARSIPIDEALRDRLLDLCATAGTQPGALRDAVRPAARARLNEIADAIARLTVRRDAAQSERDAFSDERDALRDHRDIQPAAHPARDYAARDRRPGAPLWKAVDFGDGLTADQQAGLEAALHAAGLVDAWLAPDGRLTAVDGDVLLTSGPAAEAGVAALTPDTDAAIAANVVAGVLARITVVERDADQRDDGTVIGLDGSFRIGPAAGRAVPTAAQHIGAAARQAARQRRLAELDRLIADADALASGMDRDRDRMHGDAAAVEADITSVPPDDQAVSAARAVSAANLEVAHAVERAHKLRARADEAAQSAQEARRACLNHASDENLPAPGKAPELDELDRTVRDYRDLVGRSVAVRRDVDRLLARAESTQERVASLTVVAADCDTRLRGADDDAAQRAGALEAAEQTDGATAEQILARLDAVKAELGKLGEQLVAARDQRETAIADSRDQIAAHADAVRILAEREQVTAAAADGVRALARHDFCALALGDSAPDAAQAAAAQSTSRLLELFANTAQQLTVATRLETLENNVEDAVDRLRQALDGSAGLEPAKTREGSVIIVDLHAPGGRRGVRTALADLQGEIDAQQRALTKDEELAFEEFLLKGLAKHLRELIFNARQLVDETNERIRSCRTSSGVAVELKWALADRGDALLPRAVALLQRPAESLSDREREEMVGFFRDRVELARVAEDGGTVTEHLLQALDYRGWHEFSVIQIRDGQRIPLTTRTHQAGSGGEKSAALHLPLFAAMAALLRSAADHAPRIVMLDEAFAGIDAIMRRQLLGLLQQLDLDFMLTSHELWCCEPDLHALSIYNLHRDPAIEGIAADWFVWDGTAKHDMQTAAEAA